MKYLKRYNESIDDEEANNKFRCGYDSFYSSDLGIEFYSRYTGEIFTTAKLKGEMIIDIRINKENDEILFIVEGHAEYNLYVYYNDEDPSCDVNVMIDDIEGDLSDLIDQPLLQAEVSSNQETIELAGVCGFDTQTWTFYKFATIDGYVTIKWWGRSNGYYSESANLIKSKPVSREELEEIYKKIDK